MKGRGFTLIVVLILATAMFSTNLVTDSSNDISGNQAGMGKVKSSLASNLCECESGDKKKSEGYMYVCPDGTSVKTSCNFVCKKRALVECTLLTVINGNNQKTQDMDGLWEMSGCVADCTGHQQV
jgi:hypothetical protein|tara:strand:+ start:500 stop:874 length:375 start_codon:yes stop_codon:yes gene_type:complete